MRHRRNPPRSRADALGTRLALLNSSTDVAVVDHQLRVRRLDGLRVVDASIIPRIPRGHTNLPTMIIAEKAADLIRGTASTSPPATAGTKPPLPTTPTRD